MTTRERSRKWYLNTFLPPSPAREYTSAAATYIHRQTRIFPSHLIVRAIGDAAPLGQTAAGVPGKGVVCGVGLAAHAFEEALFEWGEGGGRIEVGGW